MWTYNSTDELYHYGVKGMKWGVRRALRKEIKSARANFRKREAARLSKEYDVKGKEKAAYDYGRKHHLDLDDGGGGNRKAGLKYNRMWEEIEYLEDEIDRKASKYAREQIINKYGEIPVKELEHHETMVGKAQIATFMAALVGTPLALTTYFAVDSIKR